jgi:DDE superfamily endonuclease
MSTESPLPTHLWDGLPPEAQALILALQAEVTDLQTRTPGLQHQPQVSQSPLSQDTSSPPGPSSRNPPATKRRPPQSPCGGVATQDAGTSPRDRLRELVHQSPRTFGKPRSTWTLQLLADVCFETGIVGRPVSAATVRRELRRMGVRWKRTKLWAPSPDPQYALKKARRDRLIEVAAKHPDWVLGFVDEVWWSRLQRPRMHAWADGSPLKMHVLKAEDSDPDPIAICCYGMLRNDTKKVMLRFAENRPLSDNTAQFVEWVCQELHAEGKKRLIVIWDDASWHASRMVLYRLRQYNRRVRREGGIEVIHFELPAGSPWLNDIEPYYGHAKRVIVEPDRKLSAKETVDRVCQHFGCPLLPYLKGVETVGA